MPHGHVLLIDAEMNPIGVVEKGKEDNALKLLKRLEEIGYQLPVLVRR